jgi:hypothetical protein
MEEKRFWPRKYNDQRDVSRDLENHPAQPGQGQSSRLRRKANTYDPWADWFNTGLDPEPITDHINPEPYFDPGLVADTYSANENISMETVIDYFGVEPEQNQSPQFLGEATQADIWNQGKQSYNLSFYPVTEYPPSVEEPIAQVAEDGLPSASGKQEKSEEPKNEYEVSTEHENKLEVEKTVETNHLVWRKFPDKSV